MKVGENEAKSTPDHGQLLSDGTVSEAPRRVAIEGGPGSGRTTLCLRLLYQWAIQGDGPALAFIVPLRELRGSPVLNYLARELFPRTAAIGDAVAQVWRTLHLMEDGVLFILDGYDECVGGRASLGDAVDLLEGRLFPDARILVTCSPSNSSVLSPLVQRRIHLAGLEWPHVERLCVAYFIHNDIAEKACEFLEALNVQPQTVKQLGQHPLGWIMLCCLYQDSGSLPTETSALVQAAVKCIVKRSLDPPIPYNEEIPGHCRKRLEDFGKVSLAALREGRCCYTEAELRARGGGIEVTRLGFLTKGLTFGQRRKPDLYAPIHMAVAEFLAAYYLTSVAQYANILRRELEGLPSGIISHLAGLLGPKTHLILNQLCPLEVPPRAVFSLLKAAGASDGNISAVCRLVGAGPGFGPAPNERPPAPLVHTSPLELEGWARILESPACTLEALEVVFQVERGSDPRYLDDFFEALAGNESVKLVRITSLLGQEFPADEAQKLAGHLKNVEKLGNEAFVPRLEDGSTRRMRDSVRLQRGKLPRDNRNGVFVKLTGKKPWSRLRERRAISESGLKKFCRGKYMYMDVQIDQFLTRSEKLHERGQQRRKDRSMDRRERRRAEERSHPAVQRCARRKGNTTRGVKETATKLRGSSTLSIALQFRCPFFCEIPRGPALGLSGPIGLTENCGSLLKSDLVACLPILRTLCPKMCKSIQELGVPITDKTALECVVNALCRGLSHASSSLARLVLDMNLSGEQVSRVCDALRGCVQVQALHLPHLGCGCEGLASVAELLKERPLLALNLAGSWGAKNEDPSSSGISMGKPCRSSVLFSSFLFYFFYFQLLLYWPYCQCHSFCRGLFDPLWTNTGDFIITRLRRGVLGIQRCGGERGVGCEEASSKREDSERNGEQSECKDTKEDTVESVARYLGYENAEENGEYVVKFLETSSTRKIPRVPGYRRNYGCDRECVGMLRCKRRSRIFYKIREGRVESVAMPRGYEDTVGNVGPVAGFKAGYKDTDENTESTTRCSKCKNRVENGEYTTPRGPAPATGNGPLPQNERDRDSNGSSKRNSDSVLCHRLPLLHPLPTCDVSSHQGTGFHEIFNAIRARREGYSLIRPYEDLDAKVGLSSEDSGGSSVTLAATGTGDCGVLGPSPRATSQAAARTEAPSSYAKVFEILFSNSREPNCKLRSLNVSKCLLGGLDAGCLGETIRRARNLDALRAAGASRPADVMPLVLALTEAPCLQLLDLASPRLALDDHPSRLLCHALARNTTLKLLSLEGWTFRIEREEIKARDCGHKLDSVSAELGWAKTNLLNSVVPGHGTGLSDHDGGQSGFDVAGRDSREKERMRFVLDLLVDSAVRLPISRPCLRDWDTIGRDVIYVGMDWGFSEDLRESPQSRNPSNDVVNDGRYKFLGQTDSFLRTRICNARPRRVNRIDGKIGKEEMEWMFQESDSLAVFSELLRYTSVRELSLCNARLHLAVHEGPLARLGRRDDAGAELLRAAPPPACPAIVFLRLAGFQVTVNDRLALRGPLLLPFLAGFTALSELDLSLDKSTIGGSSGSLLFIDDKILQQFFACLSSHFRNLQSLRINFWRVTLEDSEKTMRQIAKYLKLCNLSFLKANGLIVTDSAKKVQMEHVFVQTILTHLQYLTWLCLDGVDLTETQASSVGKCVRDRFPGTSLEISAKDVHVKSVKALVAAIEEGGRAEVVYTGGSNCRLKITKIQKNSKGKKK
ncbi:Protein NLRC5 [Eufriesea mexicana]|nr:Protein NLRC5 [Eufriesea mexicana]